MSVISRRTSCRDYLEEDVPEELVLKCLEAARLAPSACNKQPWRFVAVRDKERRAAICSRALLPGIPMPWLGKAPVIIALCAEKSMMTHKLPPMLSGIYYHLIDIGIAGEHFVLAAESLGLGTCWIGWIIQSQIKKILAIPRHIEVLSLISLGFPASPPSPVSRMEMKKIAFAEEWGKTR
jgi:nitroreductase